MKKFQGDQEATLSAEIELITTTEAKKQTSRPPISLQFQVWIAFSHCCVMEFVESPSKYVQAMVGWVVVAPRNVFDFFFGFLFGFLFLSFFYSILFC